MVVAAATAGGDHENSSRSESESRGLKPKSSSIFLSVSDKGKLELQKDKEKGHQGKNSQASLSKEKASSPDGQKERLTQKGSGSRIPNFLKSTRRFFGNKRGDGHLKHKSLERLDSPAVDESTLLDTKGKSISELNLLKETTPPPLNDFPDFQEEEEEEEEGEPLVSVQKAVAAIESLNCNSEKVMGNSCSYNLKHDIAHVQDDHKQMSDSEDGNGNVNGNMGRMNGFPSGNVKNKASAFSLVNARSSQSQSQSLNSSSSASSSSSCHLTSSTFQQTNETSSSNQQYLNDMRRSISNMKELSTTTSSESSSTTTMKGASSSKLGRPPLKLNTSMDLNGAEPPLDTGRVLVQEVNMKFPSSGEMQLHKSEMPLESPNLVKSNNNQSLPNSALAGASSDVSKHYHYEQKKTASSSSTKVRSGSYSAEQSSANAAETKRVQSGNVKYEESHSALAMRQKVEKDGVTAEKSAALKQQQRSVTQGDLTQEESRTAAAAAMKVSAGGFTAEKRNIAAEERKQTLNQGTVINTKQRYQQASQSKVTFNNQTLAQTSFEDLSFDDLDSLSPESVKGDIENVTNKYCDKVSGVIEQLNGTEDGDNSISNLTWVSEVMKAAWKVPRHGHHVGENLCKTFRKAGGLDVVISNFNTNEKDLKIASAKLLEQSLTPENCSYLVEKVDWLDKVVKVASELCDVEESRVGTGLLRHLFRHSESTCSDILRLHGLERLMTECRRMDVETLRNCAAALVNLSLYGGSENQEVMIKKKVHMWLFPLAFNQDDTVKYHACLAYAALVANKEIEAQIIKSNTIQLVEPFLSTHNPEDFANTCMPHEGHNAQWLSKLVPVLSSQREVACSIAAFHFCMEAVVKKREGKESVFKEIQVIEPLKRVASSPNALASKFAAQALRIIGETVPHKLSQQVPLWSTEDVKEWVLQKGFEEHSEKFLKARVDGDLLLQLTEDMLKNDIGMENGILRKRFMRDLKHLMKMADYSSCDQTNLNEFLSSIHPDFCAYTYTLLNNHMDKDVLRRSATEEVLKECGITNSIHRKRILDAVNVDKNETHTSEDNPEKPLDVFISYRRSNGSQLASLLKVHLQLRGFSVFIDVERLEAGKFDNNLLRSIRQARHFILVLTPNALDRCIQDDDCKDWVHREIVAALENQCNIIPIMDNFMWPESLPEDMQTVHTFNGVKWIHDYQDACVEKLERFLRGEAVPRSENLPSLTSNRDRDLQSSGSCTSGHRPCSQYQRTLSVGSESNRTES